MINFATNQATAELVIPLIQDDLEEGEETIRLSLASVQGNHGIGWQGTTEVVILDADTPAHFSQVEFPGGPAAVGVSKRATCASRSALRPNPVATRTNRWSCPTGRRMGPRWPDRTTRR
ncbi:MAG: hypothetical protein KIT22_01215 [Verrucomicrobiae bacterium]|nr:hypothetical protein [Verrucomicrobiae bacterium]